MKKKKNTTQTYTTSKQTDFSQTISVANIFLSGIRVTNAWVCLDLTNWYIFSVSILIFLYVRGSKVSDVFWVFF